MVDSKLVRGFHELKRSVKDYGLIRGTRRWASLAYLEQTRGLPDGENVFNRDWDLLVILDACRVDELQRAINSGVYNQLTGPVDTFQSLASCTWEWAPKTFDDLPESIGHNTAYVSANPNADVIQDTVGYYDAVWEYAWDDSTGTVHPSSVTDRSISVGRDKEYDRVIAHYLQPHGPFIPTELGSEYSHFEHESDPTHGIWHQVQRGQVDRDAAIKGYRQNLELVLEYTERLLSNFTAETAVVTADHGECFGEWGIYGHPGRTVIDELLTVPWVELTTTDSGTYTPEDYDQSTSSVAAEDRLQALGYK